MGSLCGGVSDEVDGRAKKQSHGVMFVRIREKAVDSVTREEMSSDGARFLQCT